MASPGRRDQEDPFRSIKGATKPLFQNEMMKAFLNPLFWYINLHQSHGVEDNTTLKQPNYPSLLNTSPSSIHNESLSVFPARCSLCLGIRGPAPG